MSTTRLKCVSLAFVLIFLSGLCFGQNRLRITGKISAGSSLRYQLQVGAFKINSNAQAVFQRLSRAGLKPVFETYRDLTRVIVPGVSVSDMCVVLSKIESAGFYDVIIRPENAATLVSALPEEVFGKKWRAVRVNGEDSGKSAFACIFYIDRDGSYRVEYLDGNPLSQRGRFASALWRAGADGNGTVFEYSWFNWQNAGRARIRVASDNYLIIEDLHGEDSKAEKDIWEFQAE
ncbi:MAG: SPOR domain-containing protein [Treponema sp.]|jgi:hypothetical protein|nr:SPOR domain-containing protein [Treponema sp.]